MVLDGDSLGESKFLNPMKKYLITSLLALVFSVTIAVAATTDFTANSDITISAVTFGSGTADMLILNNSTAESWNYDAGAFTVTNPGTFNVGSGSSDSAVKTVRMTQGGSTVACALNTTPATSYVTAPTAAATYTVVPSALTTCQDVCSSVSNAATLNSYPTCGAATCSSGYDLSGSGATATCVARASSGSGGRRIVAPPPPLVAPPVSVPLPVFVNPPGIAITLPARRFTRTIQFGSSGNDVKDLQRFLNSRGFAVALTGPGSPGRETAYFGPATKMALIKFQLTNEVIKNETASGAGIFGPKTRAKINELGKIENLKTLMTQLVQLLEQLRQLQGYQQ